MDVNACRLLILQVLATSALAAASDSPVKTKQFVDPAPPKVATSPATSAPPARDNPEATFHASPKPLPKGAVTSDWPSFLGPTHNMFSPETKLLHEFPKDGLRLVWEMKKGDGFAAPAVLGDRLVVFHRVDDNEVIDCLHPLDGKRYWRFSYATTYRDRYGINPGPRCAPVIGDGLVFTFGNEGKLHCLDLQTGEVRWKRNLVSEFGLAQNFFGVGATPLIEGDKLIVNVGAPGGPCVAAFDLRTGKMRWGAGTEWGPSYASPIPGDVHGKRRVFVFAGGESKPATGGLLGIDPENGHVDFTFPWRGNRYESVNAASPVILGNRVFVSECYGSGGVLVDLSPEWQPKPLWSNPTFGMHFMTAIPKEGYLYGVDGHGPQDADFVCVDLNTGKEVWRKQPIWEEKVESARGARDIKVGTFLSFLLMVDGRTLCLGEYGHLLWLDLSPKGYRELARTWLFSATESWTPPVVSRGLLYVCQNTKGAFRSEPTRLLCYDLRAAE